MAGRPRTMLKRVTRILERQRKLAEELRKLMPKQYLPGPGEAVAGSRWRTQSWGSHRQNNISQTGHTFFSK